MGKQRRNYWIKIVFNFSATFSALGSIAFSNNIFIGTAGKFNAPKTSTGASKCLKHAFDILRGKFSGKSCNEQISPFQALMSSMAATLGTNIDVYASINWQEVS